MEALHPWLQLLTQLSEYEAVAVAAAAEHPGTVRDKDNKNIPQ
jgi:hypothetical protein